MPNLLAVLLAGIYILQASASNQKQYDEPFVIAGYWPNYRTYINIVQTSSQILTDIIIFSIEPQATKSIINDDVCCIGKEQYAKAREARRKSHNSSMNLFVSIGGGGRSSAMKEISASKERRMAFIRDLKALCLKEDLNGVDFDWEQPSTQQEYIAYMNLIVESAVELHRNGLLVSVALHPQQLLPEDVYSYVDRIHLMAYDMVEPNGYHASFDNAVKAVEILVQSGCQSSKIVLGIPAYARHETNPSHVKTQSELIDEWSKEVERTKEQFLAISEYKGYSMESQDLIHDKVEMAMGKGLGGVFIWELGQDYRNHDSFKEGMIMGHIKDAVDSAMSSRDTNRQDEL